jgi:CRP-like cAMP-binding protein
MEFSIIKFLSQYIDLSEEFKKVLEASSLVQCYKKGTVLLKEGQVPKEGYLVIHGCVRSYYIKDGEEVSTAFFTDKQAVACSAYDTQTASKHFLDCTEETWLLVGSKETEQEILGKYPEAEKLCRIMTEQVLGNQQDEYDYFRLNNPEERYVRLLADRPELVQRVPQYQIASYLGMKPESLSRIRKRMLKS